VTLKYDLRAEDYSDAKRIAISSGLVKHSPSLMEWKPHCEGMVLREMPTQPLKLIFVPGDAYGMAPVISSAFWSAV